MDIAIWSYVEVGLGITAGSLASLRPLLRRLRAFDSDQDYNPPVPGRSGAILHGGSRDKCMPLTSLDNTAQLRHDKISVLVTTIQGQERESCINMSSRHSSQEQLNDKREMGLEIYRTIEVTSTSTSTADNMGSVLREHV